MQNNNIKLSIRLIANTPETREKGLMFTDPLSDDEAAYFVFPRTGSYAFWNKNVRFALSLAFLDEFGQIVDFADMEADSPKRAAPSSDNVKYVVEANKGLFKRLGIEKGDLIRYADDNCLYINRMQAAHKYNIR